MLKRFPCFLSAVEEPLLQPSLAVQCLARVLVEALPSQGSPLLRPYPSVLNLAHLLDDAEH